MITREVDFYHTLKYEYLFDSESYVFDAKDFKNLIAHRNAKRADGYQCAHIRESTYDIRAPPQCVELRCIETHKSRKEDIQTNGFTIVMLRVLRNLAQETQYR